MKRFRKINFILLLISIVIAVTVEVGLLVDADFVEGYNYLGWVFLFIYFLYPVIIIGIIVLAAFLIKKYGFISGFVNLRWEFALIVCHVFIILASAQLNSRLDIGNKLKLIVTNETNYMIGPIYVYGRHEKIAIDTLKEYQTIELVYRGKNIDYRTNNDFENRIIVNYEDNLDWKSKTIVGMSRGVMDSLVVKFVEQDSIVAEVW